MICTFMFAISGGLLALLGLLSAGTALAGSRMSQKAAEKANETNIELQNSANETNLELARMQNQTAIVEAQKNRDFQERMSNTEVQRRMSDLQAAGVNPLMALNNMGGSAPSGSLPSISSARVEAAKVFPASLDLSPVASALQSISTIALISALGKKADAKMANKKLMDGMEIL